MNNRRAGVNRAGSAAEHRSDAPSSRVGVFCDLTIWSLTGRGGEMAYAEDLKSSGAKAPCGFDPRPRQLKINGFLLTERSKQDHSIPLTAAFDSHGLRDSEAFAYKPS